MFKPFQTPSALSFALYLGRSSLSLLRNRHKRSGRSLRPRAVQTAKARSGASLADLMATPLVTVLADDPLEAVSALFVTRNIGAAPVVDGENTPLGIVTKTDILSALHAGDAGHWRITAHPRPLPCALEPELPTAEFHPATASDLMTPLVMALPSDAPIEQAAALMAYEGIHHILVRGPDQALVGMVSSHDMVSWFARAAAYPVPTHSGGNVS